MKCLGVHTVFDNDENGPGKAGDEVAGTQTTAATPLLRHHDGRLRSKQVMRGPAIGS